MTVPLIPGLDWCFAGLLAAFVASIGLVLQVLVLGVRAPRGERLRHLRAAALGPLAAIVIGVLLGIAVDLFSTEHKRMLDRVFFVLPMLAGGAWFWINRTLIRKLDGPTPEKVRRPVAEEIEKVE